MKSSIAWGGASTALLLLLAGCGSSDKSEESRTVSQDQMNHYAGIEEHDHPVATPGNEISQPPPATNAEVKK